MKTLTRLAPIFLTLMLLTLPALAQDEEGASTEPIHPFLKNKFSLGIGGFWPDKDVTIRADGTLPGEEIDFDEDLGFSESDSSYAALFRWRFGKKWEFQAQSFKLDSTSSFTLEEDIQFEDVLFREGSFVESGVDLMVARVFFGRKFSSGPRHEFGLGLGFHWLELDVFIQGEVKIDDETTEFQRADADADFPMPNLGAWYYYAFSPKWLLNARVDWLDVSVDKYSGGLWNALLGIAWNPHKNWGFGLAVNSFGLDGSITDTDWRGKVDYTAFGPLLTITANW